MPKIIGRTNEEKILEAAFMSDDPEFIALYGRRRVGKTYLVRNFFDDKKDTVFFYASGIKNGLLLDQTQNFLDELSYTFSYRGPLSRIAGSWNSIFRLLTEVIRTSPKKKIILFFDEFPWMATHKSKLLQMLDYFWNRHWSLDGRIKLIICGSSTSWILKKIVNNRGGLYNRVTKRIHLMPYNLKQTEEFLRYKKIKLNKKDITLLYMVLGGIPYYLSQVKPGLSAAQNIEELGFKQNSFLLSEFDNLYATLFDSDGAHTNLARAISSRHYGISHRELAADKKLSSSGGTLTKWLTDLVEAGFIARFVPHGSHSRNKYYKLEDEYSLFYFRWIEPIKHTLIVKSMRKGYWQQLQSTPAWVAWSGYAFETLCMKHVAHIAQALQLSPLALPTTWRYIPKKESNESGAQIDLLFDRKDNAITLCEIKYTQQPFVLDKNAATKLVRQFTVFLERTKTKKNVFIAVISAQGLKKNQYTQELVHTVVTLDDLFKKAN